MIPHPPDERIQMILREAVRLAHVEAAELTAQARQLRAALTHAALDAKEVSDEWAAAFFATLTLDAKAMGLVAWANNCEQKDLSGTTTEPTTPELCFIQPVAGRG